MSYYRIVMPCLPLHRDLPIKLPTQLPAISAVYFCRDGKLVTVYKHCQLLTEDMRASALLHNKCSGCQGR